MSFTAVVKFDVQVLHDFCSTNYIQKTINPYIYRRNYITINEIILFAIKVLSEKI